MIKYLKILLTLTMLTALSASAQYSVEWAQGFGGDGWDEACTCIETRSGDFIIGGYAKLKERNMWIVKLYSDGRGRWGKAYEDYAVSAAHSMVETYDRNIVIAGYAIRKREVQSNLLVMKIDTLGNVLWQKLYGGTGDEEGYKIIETKDHGYAIAGYTTSNHEGKPSWYMVRLDEDGNKLWDKQFMEGDENRALGIAQTYDGNFVVTGYIGSDKGGRKNMIVIKMDDSGEEKWMQWFDFNDWCSGQSIIATRDSNIVVTGFTRAYSITDYDAITMKLTNDGDSIWVRTYGNEDWEEGTDIIETYDGAYVMSGFSKSNKRDNSNFLMVKYDSRGHQMWEFNFKRKSQDYSKSIVETHEHGLLLVGTTNSLGKGWDFGVLKMENAEKTELQFHFPLDSISATQQSAINVTLCLNSFGIPVNVKVYVNGQLQINENDFLPPTQADRDAGCDFPLSYDLALAYGVNTIRYVVKDYKNYEFSKELKIYRLPKQRFVR